MKKLLLLLVLPVMLIPATASAVDIFGDNCKQYDSAYQANKDDPNIPTVCKEKYAQREEDKTTGEQQNPLFGPDGIITFVINLLSVVAGIAAVIMIILAGLKFITSGSNPQDANNAREMVLYAAIGILIASSAQLIVRIFLFKIGG